MFCPEEARSARDPIKRFGTDSRSYLSAPSGLIGVEEITQGKPWAKLFWPLRATDWAASGFKDGR